MSLFNCGIEKSKGSHCSLESPNPNIAIRGQTVNRKDLEIALLGLLLSAPVSQAYAQAASNVICNRCVGTTDLANQSVQREKIADGAVTAVKIRDNNVTGAKIAAGAVGVTQIDPEQVQMRVGGSCPVGTSIAAVAENGSVTCRTLETQRFSFASNSGVAAGQCPAGTSIVSANCDCESVNGTRNFGVLFGCQVAGNGGASGCIADAGTFNPTLPGPRADLTVLCLEKGTVPGTSSQQAAEPAASIAVINASFQAVSDSFTSTALAHDAKLRATR